MPGHINSSFPEFLLHVQESVNLTIYLYAQTMGQQRMLYIRKFIYIYIYLYSQVGHRDTTTMARKDLRARGGLVKLGKTCEYTTFLAVPLSVHINRLSGLPTLEHATYPYSNLYLIILIVIYIP